MNKFTIENLLDIYRQYKKMYGKDTYKYISQILMQAKPLHKKSFHGNDHEQSWRAFKGKNLEKLIIFIIKEEVEELGLNIVDGNRLERTKENNLSPELSTKNDFIKSVNVTKSMLLYSSKNFLQYSLVALLCQPFLSFRNNGSNSSR